ncbi:hypothetical protein C3L33_05644, partial [Rhododendron williamsianum]
MRYNDIMILNCKENMNKGKTYTYFSSLPEMLNEENKPYPPYHYVLKSDDDTYFRLENLVESLRVLPREDLYYGYVIPCPSMDPFNQYMSGMGFLVSWDIVSGFGFRIFPKVTWKALKTGFSGSGFAMAIGQRTGSMRSGQCTITRSQPRAEATETKSIATSTLPWNTVEMGERMEGWRSKMARGQRSFKEESNGETVLMIEREEAGKQERELDETTEESILRYYICNPTIKRFTRIPLLGVVYDCTMPNGDSRVHHKLCNYKIDKSTRPWSELNITLVGVYVAFDPLVSPHYSVVCVWEWNAAAFNYKVRIAVFRSEVGLWGELMGPFTVPDEVLFENGVFWNGGVHWISNRELVCFDVEGGGLRIVPLPLSCGEEKVAYFGESRGHLQVVVNDKAAADLFHVFEMKKDFSGWVSVFCCDLNRGIFLLSETSSYYISSAFSLVFLGRGESEDESFFVVDVSGKLFSYDIKNQPQRSFAICHILHHAIKLFHMMRLYLKAKVFVNNYGMVDAQLDAKFGFVCNHILHIRGISGDVICFCSSSMWL